MFSLGPSAGFLQKFLQQSQPDMANMDPGTGERSPMSVMRPQVVRPQMPTFLPNPGIMPGQSEDAPGQQKKRPSIFGMFGGDTSQRPDAIMGALKNLGSNGGIFKSYGQQQGPSQYPTSRLRLF